MLSSSPDLDYVLDAMYGCEGHDFRKSQDRLPIFEALVRPEHNHCYSCHSLTHYFSHAPDSGTLRMLTWRLSCIFKQSKAQLTNFGTQERVLLFDTIAKKGSQLATAQINDIGMQVASRRLSSSFQRKVRFFPWDLSRLS